MQRFAKMLADVRVTYADIADAGEFAQLHGVPFNFAGWDRIVSVHDGRIPVRIKAAPEGLLIPTRNVLATVENTDPTMPWLTSYIETALLRAVWYPTTVATRVHTMKQRIKPFYDATGNVANMGFGILDFSARGCSSRETAEVGGLAHMLSFIGSDNLPAILAADRYYDEPMAAYSVAATEHSVTTSWGREGENASIEYLIDNMMPENGILSMVGDTYNIYEFVHKIAKYQDRIANKGGTVVIRPDSGDMQVVLRKVIADVRDEFWNDRNEKGYLMPRRVKVLQGDGINENSVVVPFQIAKELGVSADAIMTGSGGGLMQANIDRDTCKFAFKASNVRRNGVDIPIAKDPITDPGKRSKMGRLMLVGPELVGEYKTISTMDAKSGEQFDTLRTIYENGKLSNMEAFSTIRERLSAQL
ncbi:MAG: nicotinate phosphoribosyltransferase [Cytophagaceae bacterium]|nr:MAG: nicotinate phosphoribosyltransferase [Cytophagaceae bacterium]